MGRAQYGNAHNRSVKSSWRKSQKLDAKMQEILLAKLYTGTVVGVVRITILGWQGGDLVWKVLV